MNAWDDLIAQWEAPENDLGYSYTFRLMQDEKGAYVQTVAYGKNEDGEEFSSKSTQRVTDTKKTIALLDKKANRTL